MPAYTKEQQTYQAGTPEAAAILKRSGSKYKNKKTQGRNRMYDSGIEKEFADLLEWRKQSGEIKDYREQVTLKLRIFGAKVCDYRIDFIATHLDDRLELFEVKGFETDVFRIKWALTKALLPKGGIPDIPKDSRLTMVKRQGKNGFSYTTQNLDYTD